MSFGTNNLRPAAVWISLLAVCVVLTSQSSASQQRTSLLQGSVIEAGSETPIDKVTIELRADSSTASPALMSSLTDSNGRFYLPIPNPGSYRIVAVHPGHVTANLPFNSSNAAPVRIPMTAAGVISGHILDKGKPIGLADAVVLKAIFTEGQLSFTPVLAIRADDQGEYHLFWLPPGRYYLVGVVWDIASSVPRYISPTGNDDNYISSQRYVGRAVFLRATAGGVLDNEAHIPIFYPGTPDPRMALPIEVTPGAQLRGMDIDASAVPTHRVLGRVDGIPARGGERQSDPIRLSVDMRPLITSLYTNPAQSPETSFNLSGNFEIRAAAPGRYLLTATAGNLTGRTIVEVRDRDVTNVVVALSPGSNISGRITIEGNASASASSLLNSVRVVLRSDPLIPGVSVTGVSSQADGTFTITGVPASGDYRVLVTPLLTSATPPGSTPATIPPALQSLYVKSIRMGDVDVLNDRLHLENLSRDPLLIVLGSNPGKLEGHTMNVRRQPVGGMTVVLAHDSGLRYRVNEKVSVSDASGRFEFQNVPPGNYKLFAWETVEPGAWQDPDFMRPFEASGVPVHIDESASVNQDIAIQN